MSRAAGLAIGGAVLSITIGVMVGLVIHAGQVERAEGSAQGRSAAAASTSTDSGPESVTLSSPTPAQSTAPSESPQTSSLGTPDTATLSSASSLIPSTTGKRAGTTAATTSTPPTISSTGPTGVDSAEAPCPTLANKSSDAVGTTLYCQVDQSDRTLRWRAVVDKGGCLNQKMVGIGADGAHYRCVQDASGRNHWQLAN